MTTDACKHYAAWPIEITRTWISDLVCGDIDFAGKTKAAVAEFDRWAYLRDNFTEAELLRFIFDGPPLPPQPHGLEGLQAVIPLPAAGWMLMSALATLWLVRRVRA